MTPAARLSAAMQVLDAVLSGQAVEPALATWGRAHRFAGSADRAALRDLVFDALRCRRSHAARGGGLTGRGLVLGGQRAAGADVDALFTGLGHAPAPVDAADAPRDATPLEALDCPDWLAPSLQASLGATFAPVMRALQHRAPVFLRVNARRSTREAAIAALAVEEITAEPHPLAAHALRVTGNARKIQSSRAYLTGLVELQDAASQAVVQALPLRDGQRVLDYCAGGGGKTLAMAAAADLALWAHDAHPARLRDLPARAERAGVRVTLPGSALAAQSFDLVLADVPCSGSGSWRRDPAGKWALTPARLAELLVVQAGILDATAPLVSPGGTLAYVTCSLLRDENEDQVAAFLRRAPGWILSHERRFTPLDGGDGFYVAILTR